MPPLSREILHSHHGLSQRQINEFLGVKGDGGGLEEKITQMKMVGEFIEVTDLLRKANISFVPFKGPLLSYRIYNDSTIRRYKDFDFLIDFKHMDKAISVLLGAGFQPGEYDWPTDKEVKKFKKTLRNQYLLVHPNKRASVELHWNILKYPPLNKNLFQKVVSENISEIKFLGRDFTLMNIEMELLYLLIHGGFHNWRRLKWLVDVHEIIESGSFDKGKFTSLVKEIGAQRVVNHCNGVLRSIYPEGNILPEFGKPSKSALKLSLKKIEGQYSREYESLNGLIRYSWFILTAFPGLKYKFRVIKTWILSAQDAGSERLSFWTLFKSMFNPSGFLKKRYRV